jgi:hypothetical protein
MKYKQQILDRTEATTNLLETLERALLADAMSKTEVLNLIKQIRKRISEIENFTDLED